MLPATTRWLARGLSHRKLRLARMRPTESRSALFGIVAGIFVSGTGIGSLLPILPLYLRERGASYALVGVIVGSALLAGHRPVAGGDPCRARRREDDDDRRFVVAAVASVTFRSTRT